jgi:hypothetical protein
MLGFSVLTLVGSQQGASRQERERESSFALSEGVLNSQIYLLSRGWPGTAGQAYNTCNAGTGADSNCPDPGTLQQSFTGADYNAGLTWSTELHDNTTVPGDTSVNTAAKFYDDASVRAQPRWDSNRDGFLWLRAQANTHGHRRTLVALIKAEELTALFPRNAVVANNLTIGPNGNQTYVETQGSYVILRCNGMTTAECEAWGRTQHVGPNADVRIVSTQKPALSPETLERMRDYAKANGTYFTSCPSSLTGDIVFIETANCSYKGQGGTEWNTAQQPGVLIIGSGAIDFGGNGLYHGVLYHLNGSDGVGQQISGDVVTIQGNVCISGSVVIDGPGGLKVGASNGANRCAGNIDFEANAANNLKAYGTAGIVQNSFREIQATN